MCLELLGRVLDKEGDGEGIAIVDIDGKARRISLALLTLEGTHVAPGDWILCHTGLAVRVVEENDARILRERRDEMRAALNDGEL